MSLEVITKVLKPADDYDLTTLANAREDLSITNASDTSNDNFLNRAITEASVMIANYCNRVFPTEGVQDRFYFEVGAYPFQVPGGVGVVQLSRWPVQPDEVVSTFTGTTTNGSAVVTGLSRTTDLLVGTPVSGTGIPAGATIASVDASSSSLTLSAPATADGSPVTISTFLVVVQNTTLDSNTVLTRDKDYRVDPANGQLIFLDNFTGLAQRWPTFPLLVQYAGGFDDTPADLEQAVLRMVVGRFRGRGRDPMLTSQSGQGTASMTYWVGGLPGQRGALPPEIQSVADNYRVPVVS